MKKLTSLLLAAVMLFALAPMFSAYAYEEIDGAAVIDGTAYVNIAVGKKYTTTGTAYVGNNIYSDTNTDGTPRYRLTDGKVSLDGMGDIGCHEGTDTEVVIDLEKLCTVKAVETDLWGNTGWGISNPDSAKIDFFYSEDGVNYKKLGDTVYEEDKPSWVKGTFSAKSETAVNARYIRLHYNTGRFRWSSEIKVYGKGEIAEKEHDIQEIGGVKYVRDFGENCDVSNAIVAFGGNDVVITSADGKTKTSGNIATGDKIKAKGNTYTVVVRGDISGDGKVGVLDYVYQRLNILRKCTFTKAQELAADIDKNGSVQPLDYITVRRYILKVILDLDGTPAPVKVPVTMPEIDEYIQTSVSKTASSVTFTANSTQESGHKTEISMVKTAWGTWNLGYFKATNTKDNKTVTMNPGGTDWEYVYRVGETAGDIKFCGGNHNNEKLIDIAFYDAKNGEQLSTEESFTATANGVKIVEHTQIYFANQPDKPFVNVTRNYLVNGVDVWLECDYDFIKDALFNLSYTGMFCVPKVSGNHIIYNNIDGTTKQFDTALSGTASGSEFGGDFDYGNPATSVEIYGDNTPEYRMHVEIYDQDVMADNFTSREKTFFWDMSSSQNKLYFSKFDNTKAHKVEKDTHWDTLIRWSFYSYTK